MPRVEADALVPHQYPHPFARAAVTRDGFLFHTASAIRLTRHGLSALTETTGLSPPGRNSSALDRNFREGLVEPHEQVSTSLTKLRIPCAKFCIRRGWSWPSYESAPQRC